MTGGARKGAGRPRIYPAGRVTRTMSLDRRADEAVRRYAEEHGLSKSQAASVLILRASSP